MFSFVDFRNSYICTFQLFIPIFPRKQDFMKDQIEKEFKAILWPDCTWIALSSPKHPQQQYPRIGYLPQHFGLQVLPWQKQFCSKTHSIRQLYWIQYSRYPLELHLVHRNIHDDTVQEALTHENGMTVLGFKFKIVDDENVNMNSISPTILKNWGVLID